MTASFESTHPAEIAPFVGKHIIYTYENGWQYEIYIKNERTLDYRVHGGLVGGRWVKDQPVHVARLADDIVKVSWTEPTGTCVSLAFNFAERRSHGATFFPRWIVEDPKKITCFQNEHLEAMQGYREAGPTYPIEVVDEFSRITFVEDCGRDNESVIACAPEDLPEGYTARRN
ncbi:phenolic acid decarboxylase [Reyranella sp.]|jgi:phenolic acid decarboxylase|uniref:phenolic acid decarboxylase n=1 Tax=Reyranella sp. TaxID=1929291 RepID=UPI000BC7B76F|nr:phenolic acid decarboxylase [Reyranella sp.]OYY43716.1 MAG: phenolic acid decarboxylase [Rhodospirillales bacterium 35-66-84]OYZ94544.1 MAG: phenolic acid decarboxylase [Rhodospirillales bacterium 24-66-33]OZB25560.1 MAG: phenolic acid decarboxylase [Rhodospirillales bacterium 39-66-50]HQS16722.1 phenolic acid decarboxylase [Reyranella sp.]HQT13530.1 phenolic acid decarboxylase [Reyranella sp.]